ncbi:hypothetical protein [Cardinium endosymbiont of Philonthus spinipes]|uniref:hypothetical protein n=1 Tax=Cardinium endosymbiont of Philonthus spinipes TaxID=3077941 RepID=UPI00313BC860
MYKNLNNYVYKLGLLFACTLSINFTNKIVYCALLFTALTVVLNSIAKWHGSKKAAISILLCSATSFAFLYDKQYYISGKLIHGLILTSLCAILVASYIGLKLFLKLQTRYGFAASNCISLFISSLVDHLIMGLFFTRVFPIRKVWLIVYQETAYIYLFSAAIYLGSAIILYAKPAYIKVKKQLRLLCTIRSVKSKIPPL